MRKYGKWLLVLGILSANPAWVSADGLLSGLRSGQPNAGAQVQNQAKAQQVADALKQARINGYDLSVEVNGGTVKLDGKVRDVTHRTLAEQTVRKVTGVTQVVNKLKYVPTGAIQQTAGEMTDSGLRPAVYEQSAGSESSIEQVHFQKPGKRSQRSTASSSSGSTSGGLGGALSRFLPRRQATPTRSTQQRSAQTRQPSQPNRQTASAGPATPRPQPPKAMAPPAAAAQPKSSDKPEALVRQTAAPAAFEPAPVNFATAAKPVAKPQATPAAPKTTAPKAAPTPQAFSTAAAPAQQQPAAPQQSNQEVAQQIASYLAKVGLVGYDVEIRYDNGVATLNGDVATVQQLQAAAFAASQVDAVQNVQNNLKVKGPIAQASFAGAQNGGVQPVAMAMPAPMPAAMMAGMHPGATPAPAPIGAAGNYSNPHLPNHAWPAYAAYPNSAAVSYPKQYSASAWPYIGPFYPYPQVPLGWREVSLQWDDGHWMIDFEKKKKAWYWLYHPKNWY